MSLNDKIIDGKLVFGDDISKLFVKHVKQTIKDFTEELKREFNEWYEKKEKLPHLMWNRIDKLNQKHYGDKLIHSPIEDGNSNSSKGSIPSATPLDSDTPICEKCGKTKEEHSYFAEGKLTTEGLYCDGNQDNMFKPKVKKK